MRGHASLFRTRLLAGAAMAAACAFSGAANAQDAKFNIPAQPLAAALNQFGAQSDTSVLFTPAVTAAKTTHGVSGAANIEVALNTLLDGTGLTFQRKGDTFLIVAGEGAAGPQGSGANGGAETNVVQELIVTAQKKEEAIQTVPIAISAFTQKSLEEQHIEGGFDLLKAIPNVTFSKNNFTSYNFSIRGIGTKAVSATTDPGVAVAFNNTALIQNRLFEQEYFDIERVEVLRGPQGTLYGRNATAGVINVISAKPTDHFEGSLKAEVGNYQSRRATGMINIPIIGDKLDLRLAGSLTQRDGYDFNSGTGHPVNGRNLWSGRLTVGFKPFERLHGNFIWEHFSEDDDRSRTGKQLCHHDAGLSKIGDFVVDPNYSTDAVTVPALTSQGCSPGSLYDPSAFGTPNGLSLPFIFGPVVLGDSCPGGPPFSRPGCPGVLFPIGQTSTGQNLTILKITDPYGGMMQSPNLRVIQSLRDPVYRAKADVFEFNVDFDLTPSLVVTSQTAYDRDSVYSFQDYNRFNTVPVFTDTSKLLSPYDSSAPSAWADLAPGGVFCDPQIGCSSSIAGFDISKAKSNQFSQELRMQSSFSGPLNFSVGANFTKFDVLVDYYVFYNVLTALAQIPTFNFQSVRDKCYLGFNTIHHPDFDEIVPFEIPDGNIRTPGAACPYIDPNPIDSIDGDGHNYFRSKNPYHLRSGSVFGEMYWQISEGLKLTAGVRYNDDRKIFTPVPSQVLTASGFALGTVNIGYPEQPDIKQEWKEFTGRLGLDWKPHLAFTDQTMLYAFYSRGYKGGGANPPGIGFSPAVQNFLPPPDYGPTFKPEFVNAFEIGTKNTLLGGAMTLNGDVFYYDYKDYQVSQIKDRTAVNENFDAKTWGLELQSVFAPSRNLQIIANFGYLGTQIGKGEKSLDLMNRTQGNPNYVLVKPWIQLPSNCVAPTAVLASLLQSNRADGANYSTTYWFNLCGPNGLLGGQTLDPATNLPYNPRDYPEINGGAGIFADLSGNELPNAPHFTTNIGAQYGIDILDGWRATLRGDAYWQSQSWARVYNDNPYDKLHGWYNVNLSLWIEKPDVGLKIEIYAKNLLDKTPITDAFLNSDDTGLTTNVFVLDPRLIGFSVTKTF